MAFRWWHATVAQGLQAAEEQSRLIHRTEWRYRSLEPFVQFQPKVGGNEQVPRCSVFGGIEKTLIQVCGEEYGVGKLVFEGFEDQDLVIEVITQHADGRPPAVARLLHLVDESLQIIDLRTPERLNDRCGHEGLSAGQDTPTCAVPFLCTRCIAGSIPRQTPVNALLICEESRAFPEKRSENALNMLWL